MGHASPMEARSSDLKLEELLRHKAWVSALAARLVRDPGTAEDVVQETWLAALEHAPGDGRPLGAWLAKVLRNAVKQRARAEGRRSHREREAARPEQGGDDASQTLLRFEAQRELADHVAALDEPFRSTVLMRYFDGLSAAAIARREGVPAGTVRWRLKEGLDRLRARMDEEHGDRRSWCLALAPLVRPRDLVSIATPVSVITVIQGVLTVKFVSALASLCVLALGLLWAVPMGTSYLAGLRAMPSDDPLPVTFRPLVQPDVEPELAAVEPAAASREEAVNAPEPVAADLDATTLLQARFVDPQGRGVAGLRIKSPSGGGTALRDAVTGARVPAVTTGADGALRARVAPHWTPSGPWDAHLVHAGPGSASGELEFVARPGGNVHLGDVVVAPGGAIAGRVVDGDGQPLRGAWVRTVPSLPHPMDLARSRRRERRGGDGAAWTDDDGRFLLEGVPVGYARLVASAELHLATFSRPVEVRAGQSSHGVELALDPLPDEDLIEGIVLGPDDEPVPHASVSYSYEGLRGSGSGSLTADQDGRFRMVLGQRTPRDIRAEAPGIAVARGQEPVLRAALAEDVEPGTRDLVLRLGEARSLELRVVDERGEPVEGPSVLATSTDGLHALAFARERAGEPGVLDLAAPSESFLLGASAPGHEEVRLGPFGAEREEAIEVRLVSVPEVTGVVLAGGEPVAGAKVVALARVDDRTEVDGLTALYGPRARVRTVSGAGGAFALTVRDAGTYVIQAEADGHAVAELGPFDIDPAAGLEGLTFDMGQGGAVEGQIIVPAGEPLAGRIVAVNRGDGRARTQRTGADGAFRFEGLTPGPWEVLLHDREMTPSSTETQSTPGTPGELRTDVVVREGETVRFDLDLTDDGASGVEVRGQLAVNGLAPGPWRAELVGRELSARVFEDREGPQRTTVAPDGSFTLRAPSAGRWRLLLTSASEAGLPVMVFRELEIGVDGADVALDLDTGSLRITGVAPPPSSRSTDPAARSLDVLTWRSGDGQWSAMAALVAEDGIADLAVVPAGRLDVTRVPMSVLDLGPPEPGAHPSMARIDLAPGQHREVALR